MDDNLGRTILVEWRMLGQCWSSVEKIRYLVEKPYISKYGITLEERNINRNKCNDVNIPIKLTTWEGGGG